GAAIALHGWERGGSGKVEKARTRREHDSTRLWAREMAQRWVVGEYNLVWALLRAAGRCLAGDAGELWNVREPEAGRVGLGEIDVVAPAALEVEARAIRFRKIPVVEYDWEGDHEGPLAVPGSAMVFIAKKGSPVLKEIRAAAKARNGSDAGVARKVFSPFRERRPMALADAVELLKRQPVFASIQYGGLTLATSLFVDEGLHACVVPLPYNGGRLAKEGFTLVEHVKD